MQTFGGYGYMQDYRVERYLRDANTLETFWIHAAARERDAASRRSNALSRGEAA
ncbi:MAG: acyl-CoA dehydrogenase family protein [Gammaproteobacteria bacterium]